MAQTNLNADQISVADFSSVKLPSGTTSERPSSPTVGLIRYNTTEDVIEGYDGSWKKFTTSSGTQTASNTITADTSTQTKVKLNLISEFYTTGAYQLPVGTTAQRPDPSANGMIRYNTTTNKFEGYKDGDWLYFETEGYFYNISYLVIAGGGSGGNGGGVGGGGGGAGGYRSSYSGDTLSGGGGTVETPIQANVGTVYTVTVGAGGNGGVGYTIAQYNTGVASSVSATGMTTISTVGGGSGGGYIDSSGTITVNGGSGGGYGSGTGYTGGTGTANQGYGGGTGGSVYHAGGGGGAGSVGGNGNSGSGGSGQSSSITGTAVVRAGGGGGGANTWQGGGSVGSGGTGGGGAGGRRTSSSAETTPGNGTANTGSGGGGGGRITNGYGGSGIVILRMPTSNYSGTTTGNPTVSTDGSDTVITFTGSGTYTS